MNKWSLLLFSVLGLLLSTTSELNFVDGRVGCCDRSSRPLLSDTRLSIYEPHCTYHTFTEISQLISPKRDIRYAIKNIELKRSSRSNGRRGQFEGTRVSTDGRFRVLNNVGLDLEDSTLSKARSRQVLRETNDLQLRRNLKSFSRDNFKENHVDRSRPSNNDFLRDKIERNSREKRIKIEEELSEIRVNRFRHNDEPVSVNLKDRKQERYYRRSFVVRTNIMLNPRENMDEIKLRFIQKNEGKRDMERNNLDINTRQRLLRDTRLTLDFSRNSDSRFKKDDGNGNGRHVTLRLTSKIGILRNRNIRNYRRLSIQGDSNQKMYERESLTDVRRNTDVTMNIYRRSYDEDISEKILERINNKNVIRRVQNERFKRLDTGSFGPRTMQRESDGLGNQIHDDKRQINNGLEKKLFEKRYSTQRSPRQNSNINRLQEIRQARFYNDIIIEDAEDYSNVFIKRTERASGQNRNRKIRENNREIRLNEEYMAERITQRNQKCLVEKQAVSSNINTRRSKAIRCNVLERRERKMSRYKLDHENNNIFDQRRIRQIINSNDEDKLRDARNTQRRLIQMGREINNFKQNYDEDSVFQVFLVRNDDNNRKLVSRFEPERLSLTSKRTSRIRIIQRENLSNMHIRAINIQENRIQEDNNFNRRLLSNTNRNVEKRRTRTYSEKSDREEFRNSMVREGERAFDERRIKQVEDNHEYRREYRLNVERTVERVLTHYDRNRNNIVGRGFVSIISRIGNNRLYGIIGSDVSVSRRRENNERKYWSVHENERVSDQRRTRDILDRREDNLRNERLAQRKLSPRDNMNNAMLNNNRRSYNDENNSQVILARTNQREMTPKLEKERFASINKRPSYLRMIQRVHKSRTHYDYKQPLNILENRLQKERYAKIIEKLDSTIRPEFVNHQNQNAKRTLILLHLREKDVPSLMHLNKRDFEQSRIGIVRNRPDFTRVEDHSRNIKVAEIRGLRNINDRSNTRDTRNRVITRYIETELEFHDSDESRYERRTERIIRNSARHRMSVNNRVLLEARSKKQRDVNRELEYIRYVRSYNGLRNSGHRENNDVRTSERDNSRGRDAKDKARDIRASNDLQITNEQMTRTNEEEQEMKTAFSKIRYLHIHHKTQSDNQIFEIKLQYIFYLLQGLYILGLFTKFTKKSDGFQKTRFSNWFHLFSTLKVH